MNTLIVDKPQAHISYKAAKLYTAQQTIPVNLIDLLVITESVTIDTKSIINIANANVPILYLSNDNKHFALTLPAIAKNGDLKDHIDPNNNQSTHKRHGGNHGRNNGNHQKG